MALVETEALILKTYNLSDADKIVVCLTRNRGLLRGVAKGAKRLKSKFGGSLEPFSIVQLTFVEREERELVSIQQVELLNSFFDQASDPYFLESFAYLVELVIDFAPPNEPNENLYKMAIACLATGVDKGGKLDAVSFYFEYWILRLGGYLPDWQSCRNCRRDFDDMEPASLQRDFDLLCGTCDKVSQSVSISAASRNLFRSTHRLSPLNFSTHIEENSDELQQLSGVVRKIISRVLDKEVIKHRTHTFNSQAYR